MVVPPPQGSSCSPTVGTRHTTSPVPILKRQPHQHQIVCSNLKRSEASTFFWFYLSKSGPYRRWLFVGTYRGSVDAVDPIVQSTGVAQVVSSAVATPQRSNASSTVDALLDVDVLKGGVVLVFDVAPRGGGGEASVGDCSLSLGETNAADRGVASIFARVVSGWSPRGIGRNCVLVRSSCVANEGYLVVVVGLGLRGLDFVRSLKINLN